MTGGTVGLHLIHFYVQPTIDMRFASIQCLSEDLALGSVSGLGLRLPKVRLSRGIEGVLLGLDHPDPRPVKLADVL